MDKVEEQGSVIAGLSRRVRDFEERSEEYVGEGMKVKSLYHRVGQVQDALKRFFPTDVSAVHVEVDNVSLQDFQATECDSVALLALLDKMRRALAILLGWERYSLAMSHWSTESTCSAIIAAASGNRLVYFSTGVTQERWVQVAKSPAAVALLTRFSESSHAGSVSAQMRDANSAIKALRSADGLPVKEKEGLNVLFAVLYAPPFV